LNAGRSIRGVADITWFNPDGSEMTEEQWQVGFAKAIGIFLNGEGIVTPDPRGEQILDNSFLLLFNAHYEPLEFVLPMGLQDRQWVLVIDTCKARFVEVGSHYEGDKPIQVQDRSMLVLRRL
ncbi:MAG: glycogen debranching enzyme, partial [Cyanobacteriota bacterium]